MTRFYYGAITPLNVEDYSIAELSEYVAQMDRYEADMEKQQRQAGG